MTPPTWKESRFLAVSLTPDEVRARGEQLAEAVRARDRLETEQKAEREEMKEDLKLAEAEVTKLAETVTTRREVRPVEVECRLDLELLIVEVIRTDTGEIIQTRGAEPRDRDRAQGTLPLEDPKPEAGATDAPPGPS